MSLKCPNCKTNISPFLIENKDLVCPSCKSVLHANIPTWSYIGFRIFAGSFALSFAQALTSEDILQWLVFLVIIGFIAYVVIQSTTSLDLKHKENEF